MYEHVMDGRRPLSIESFDPGASPLALSVEVAEELLAAAERLDEERFGLTTARTAELAAVARHHDRCDWAGMAARLESGQLVALIRLFTRAERLPGWQAGAQSPVIPMAAELKRRGDYPAELTRWIRSNTDNRFLPYGSLMDRL